LKFLINHLAKKTLSIGDKETNDYTRTEYNQLLKEALMVDVNEYKKNFIKENVKSFAKKLSVLEFNAMITVKFL
jgi:hypothetical protein